MGKIRNQIVDQNLQRVQPFMLALFAGEATLFCTLSQAYYMSTYLLFGLATAYLRIADAPTLLDLRMNSSLIKRIMRVSILTLIGFFVFVRLFR